MDHLSGGTHTLFSVPAMTLLCATPHPHSYTSSIQIRHTRTARFNFDFDFDFDFDHIREPDGHIEAFYQYERERKPCVARITKVSSLFV